MKTQVLLILLILIIPICRIDTNEIINIHSYFIDHSKNVDDTRRDLRLSSIREIQQKDNFSTINPLQKQNSVLAGFKDSEFNLIESGDYFEGFNLFIFQSYDLEEEKHNFDIVITDMKGNIVRNLDLGPSYPRNARFINSTTIIVGDLNGEIILFDIYTNKTKIVNVPPFHHDVEYNPVNNTFFILRRYDINVLGSIYRFDTIDEFDASGQLIWSLDTRSFISTDQWCPYHDYSYEVRDLTHSNTIFFDVEEDILYYNSRNLNTFYKIDHKTATVIWGLGEYGDFSLFNLKEQECEALFYHGHAVEKVDDNRFILFDNDYHNQSNSENRRSRIVEITINETDMTARESWSWTATQDYYSEIWGDADLLPNGNRLGTFGTYYRFGTNIGARLVEVNNDSQIVWEMNFPRSSEYLYGVYRMERFRLAPILNSPSDLVIIAPGSSSDEIFVNWQTWYNFRSKNKMEGTFALFVNNILVDSNNFIFNSFWRSKNLTFSLGHLTYGDYNLTLIVTDEAGHSSSDSLNISVVPFTINRYGELITEYGKPNNIIQWSGTTSSPYIVNITTDGVLYNSFLWDGSNFSLDLNLLGIGVHSVTLEINNVTDVLYEEQFWVTVVDSTKPLIINQPLDMTLAYNDSMVLHWEASDNFPSYWRIYVNDVEIEANPWNSEFLNLNWSIPLLNEGIYNLTFAVYDLLHRVTSATTWITIIPPSIPIIADYPRETNFYWDQRNIILTWEVHGANSWILWKNKSSIFSGTLFQNHIVIQIDSWKSFNWLPGAYNLTLSVKNENEYIIAHTTWIDIIFIIGDPYANSVVLSLASLNANNALGSPDGDVAQIFVDYGNGYLTLDMGENEEILNEAGNDFTIVAKGGEYLVSAGNDPSSLIQLGSGNGNASFDLSTGALEVARYVKVETSTDDNVVLDAIIAVNYNKVDSEPPTIIGPEDFDVWINQSFTVIQWDVFDVSPWNYSILVDGTIDQSGPWFGSNILYYYSITSIGIIQITLVLFDVLGHRSEDIVTIEILEVDKNETSSKRSSFSGDLILLCLITLSTIVFIFKKKKGRF
ncbi:MAG: aryl-sulfate sulfotransferase [Candidatus Hodarchaeota archaeon]